MAEYSERYAAIAAEQSENLKQGILRRINELAEKYKHLSKLVVACGIAFQLGKEAVVEAPNTVEQSIALPDIPDVPRSPRAQPINVEQIGVLEDLYKDTGDYSVDRIRHVESVASAEERKEVIGLPNKIRINGFEKYGIPNETVESVIRETLPKGFTRNLNVLDYGDYDLAMHSGYGLKFSGSFEAGHANRFRQTIRIVKGAKDEGKTWFAHNLIPHEMFHLQDWASNSLLTIDERIELYKNVIERVKADSRFRSSYVEKISDEDSKAELDRKATEYFAEIGATYVSPDYHLLPQEDKDLIKNLIAKVDPNFNRVQALKRRDELIGYDQPADTRTPDEKRIEYIKHGEQYWNNLVEMFRRRKGDQWVEKNMSILESQRQPLIEEIIKANEEIDKKEAKLREDRLAKRYRE